MNPDEYQLAQSLDRLRAEERNAAYQRTQTHTRKRATARKTARRTATASRRSHR